MAVSILGRLGQVWFALLLLVALIIVWSGTWVIHLIPGLSKRKLEDYSIVFAKAGS